MVPGGLFRRRGAPSLPLALVVYTSLLPLYLIAQSDVITSAIAAMQSGDLPSAERLLKTKLQSQPTDAVALEVLAAVLDQEKKYDESSAIYRRALSAAPRSPSLLNNYGNHLLATGQAQDAEAAFTKVLALQPAHPNASVQLARLELDRKLPEPAMRLLARLPAEIQARPDVALLRLRSFYLLHRTAEADALLARLAQNAHNDARQSLAIGAALSTVGQHVKAESFFARASELDPNNFEALYDLGLAASHAGNYEQAQTTLSQAVERQPENVDVLCDLAAVDLKLGLGDTSLELLVRARTLAPGRADVRLLLAQTASQMGMFSDALEAWNRYLELHPDDAVALREHAFAAMAIGKDTEAVLAELQIYVRKHPNDALGHYELAVAEVASDPAKAVRSLDRAITLKPDFAAAYLARGLLHYRQNQAVPALADFEKAARHDPQNPEVLARLGQTYTALNRSADAVSTLRKADHLAPANPSVLLQLGRALSKVGDDQEAAAVFARYRALGPAPKASERRAGLIEFLSLSSSEQSARYRAGVERAVQKNPENAEAQVQYLGLLLSEGKTEEAIAVARRIATLQPAAPLLDNATRQLLQAQQFSPAAEIIDQAETRGTSSPDLQIDRAIAAVHLQDAAAALQQLDHIPASSRTGDFFLERSMLMAASHQTIEAEKALDEALRLRPTRSDLYRSAVLLFLAADKLPQAAKLLDKAAALIRSDPRLDLMRALFDVLSGRSADAEFETIENRWPDWSTVWVAHALVLQAGGHAPEAQRLLDTALALGDNSPAAKVEIGENSQLQNRRVQFLNAIPLLSW